MLQVDRADISFLTSTKVIQVITCLYKLFSRKEEKRILFLLERISPPTTESEEHTADNHTL